MFDNVVYPDFNTTVPIPPEKVLEGAKSAGLEEVIVIGRKEDGEWFFASSTSHIPMLNFMADKFKQEILAE